MAGDSFHSLMLQIFTVHPLCIQWGFLAVDTQINRMQGVCPLRIHNLMGKKMVPIEIIEIIV